MTQAVHSLAGLCALSLKELEAERLKYNLKKGPRSFHDLLELIIYYREQHLLAKEEKILASYAEYVLARADDFLASGCKRGELPIVLTTLRIAGATSTPPSSPVLVYPPTQSRSEGFIAKKRAEYETRLLTSVGTPNPSVLDVGILVFLFNSINRDFFDGVLPLPKLVVSGKLTRAGAYYQKRSEGHKIVFSEVRFAHMFSGGKREALSSGVRCHNRLQWLEVTMEHELIHYFISYLDFKHEDAAVSGSHGLLFKKLAEQLFRHTCISCNTNDTSDLAKITKQQVKAGMKVSFPLKDGSIFTGKVVRVNPTTVTVQWNEKQTARCPYGLLLSCSH